MNKNELTGTTLVEDSFLTGTIELSNSGSCLGKLRTQVSVSGVISYCYCGVGQTEIVLYTSKVLAAIVFRIAYGVAVSCSHPSVQL